MNLIIGVGKTTLLHALIKKVDPISTLATNGFCMRFFFSFIVSIMKNITGFEMQFVIASFSVIFQAKLDCIQFFQVYEDEIVNNRLYDVNGCCSIGCGCIRSINS